MLIISSYLNPFDDSFNYIVKSIIFPNLPLYYLKLFNVQIYFKLFIVYGPSNVIILLSYHYLVPFLLGVNF